MHYTWVNGHSDTMNDFILFVGHCGPIFHGPMRIPLHYDAVEGLFRMYIPLFS